MSGMDLVEFLKARLDEDEQLALAAEVDFDMTRVLADVAAKRQIIEEQTNAGACQGHPRSWMPHADYRDHGDGYCRDYDGNSTLRWLASPYADHSEYQPEWKP